MFRIVGKDCVRLPQFLLTVSLEDIDPVCSKSGTSPRENYGKEREPAREQPEIWGHAGLPENQQPGGLRASKRGFRICDLRLAHWPYV